MSSPRVFVDLAKVFDTVSHPQLLTILENIGSMGITHELMKSYLSDRKQCININSHLSYLKVVEYGVPQGTVMGPLLFSIIQYGS